jgi:[glutamine synthetase] adenylyltransferase / [glutamine synthetase]-adenylyl-L-tyrosine phosphorylase
MPGFQAAQARALSMLSERAPDVAAALHDAPGELNTSAPGVLALSEFVLDALSRDPMLWRALLARSAQRLGGPGLPPPQLPAAAAGDQSARVEQELAFMAALRRWRRAEFTRIAWRDLAQWASLDETLEDLSHAAERALSLAQEFAGRALALRYGQPRNGANEAQRLIIVAMGKLGGAELNFSSDIDLVPLYSSR